jgi:hypothetical protein
MANLPWANANVLPAIVAAAARTVNSRKAAHGGVRPPSAVKLPAMRTSPIIIAVALLIALPPAAVVLANKPGEVSKPADKPAPQNAPAEPEGMTPLFNGRDLSGWTGHPKLWSVKDGVIHGETTAENKAPGNTFLVYTGDAKDTKDAPQIGDFELRFSAKIQAGNSGVQYRSKMFTSTKDNQWIVTGYQCEIAGIPGKDGFLYHEKGPKTRGYPEKALYIAWVGDKVEVDERGVSKVVGSLGENGAIAAANKKGEWNDFVIIARGNHIQQFINGVQTVDVIDNDGKGGPRSGIIALQIHAGPPMVVEFKNIRLKELK